MNTLVDLYLNMMPRQFWMQLQTSGAPQSLRRLEDDVESLANKVIFLWQLLHYSLKMKCQPLSPIRLNLRPVLLGAKCIDCYINYQFARPFSDCLS